MSMRDERYRPADVAEVEQKVSLLNEPIHDEVIELRPGQASASLHALLVGVRNQAQALLDRLETRGVYVPRVTIFRLLWDHALDRHRQVGRSFQLGLILMEQLERTDRKAFLTFFYLAAFLKPLLVG